MTKRYVVIGSGTHTREDANMPIDSAEEIEAAIAEIATPVLADLRWALERVLEAPVG